jgi:hypothetical protein
MLKKENTSVKMNKQLRQFEKESKLEIFGLGARRDKWEAALEKYAELVVKECISVVTSKCASTTAREALIEHFKIKE